MTTHKFITLQDTNPVNLTAGPDSGFDITVQNVNDSGYIYVGGSDVSSSNYGYRIAPNQAFSVELSGQDDLYVAGSTSGLSVAALLFHLEVGL
jgi:hypothetical protein